MVGVTGTRRDREATVRNIVLPGRNGREADGREMLFRKVREVWLSWG
jgi:hypothetical protein